MQKEGESKTGRHCVNTLLDTYQEMIASLDQTVALMASEYREQMSCKKGCSGCCIDGFKVRYVEALSVLKGFCELPPEMAQRVLERLDEPQVGLEVESPQQVLLNQTPGGDRKLGPVVPCPLLNDEGGCSIYGDRPTLCRAFGLILKANKTLGCCSLNFQGIGDPSGLKALDMGPYYELLDHLSLKLWEAQPLSGDVEPPRLSIRTYLKALLAQRLPEVAQP